MLPARDFGWILLLKAWKALAPLLVLVVLLVVEMMMKVLSNGVATALCKVLQGQGSARGEREESFKTGFCGKSLLEGEPSTRGQWMPL